jgi:hypothetical protein
MSKEEAQSIMDHELDRLRSMSHQELLDTTTLDPYTAEQVGPSGEKYQVKIKATIKNRKKGLVRIRASVKEAEGRHITKKLPLFGIPYISCQMVGLMTICTIGPDDLN